MAQIFFLSTPTLRPVKPSLSFLGGFLSFSLLFHTSWDEEREGIHNSRLMSCHPCHHQTKEGDYWPDLAFPTIQMGHSAFNVGWLV